MAQPISLDSDFTAQLPNRTQMQNTNALTVRGSWGPLSCLGCSPRTGLERRCTGFPAQSPHLEFLPSCNCFLPGCQPSLQMFSVYQCLSQSLLPSMVLGQLGPLLDPHDSRTSWFQACVVIMWAGRQHWVETEPPMHRGVHGEGHGLGPVGHIN